MHAAYLHEVTSEGLRLSIAYRRVRRKATINPWVSLSTMKGTRMGMRWKTIDLCESVSIRKNPCAIIIRDCSRMHRLRGRAPGSVVH